MEMPQTSAENTAFATSGAVRRVKNPSFIAPPKSRIAAAQICAARKESAREMMCFSVIAKKTGSAAMQTATATAAATVGRRTMPLE